MKISEIAQEQLEKLWIHTEERGEEVAPDGSCLATDEVDELLRLGLVAVKIEMVLLTETGKAEAGKAIRRHRLAERLLTDVLITEDPLMDERACSLEHALFDGVDESICTLLGHPQFCPHGKPIPPGKCCKQMRANVGRLIAPLGELKAGQEGRIAYIQMNNPQRLQKLMAMGVLPGVPFKVLEIYPSYVFEAGYSQFAVDEEIASDIFIRLNSD
jgi:DtxR family Mn-dependent transcriptional regulator